MTINELEASSAKLKRSWPSNSLEVNKECWIRFEIFLMLSWSIWGIAHFLVVFSCVSNCMNWKFTYIRTYGHIADLAKPWYIIWSHIVPYGPILSLMVPYGPVWFRMVQYGPVWSSMVRHGALWSCMVQNGPVRSCMVLHGGYGPIWSGMVPYGPIWSRIVL